MKPVGIARQDSTDFFTNQNHFLHDKQSFFPNSFAAGTVKPKNVYLALRGGGRSPVRRFTAFLFFLISFLSLSAQPQTFFYPAWTQTDGTVSPGFINRVVSVAGSGTVSYTASSVLLSTDNYGMRLIQYTSSGVTGWVANFDLGAGGTTHVGGITLDPSGNILVTGSAYNGSTNGHDLFLVKYNSSGTKLWHQTYNGAGTGTDAGAAVICNSSGDIFVTGVANQSALDVDALTLCYAPNGTLVWDETWDNASLIDAGATLSLLGTRVFVTGATQTNFNTWEYAVIRYEQANGSFVSATVTSAGGTNIELVSAATLDAAGNVYLTGALGVTGQGFNIKTIKLSPSLDILWTANWNGAANLDDAGRSIAVDTAGNVFVAGYTTATDRNGILLKYSPSGSLLFTRIDTAVGAGEFTGIALSSAQEPFVGGYTAQQGNKDFHALFYTNSGTLLWSDTYNGYGNSDDVAQQVTPDGLGNFLLSGTSGESTLMVKYARHLLLLPLDETVNAPFIENRGQVMGTDTTPQDDVRYYTRSNYPNTYIFDDKLSFVFAHIDTVPSSLDTMVRVDLSFVTELTTVAVGLERQEDFHNYYLGHIPEGRERVPLENKVLHPNIYTNIDAVYGLGEDGFFARFVCKPGSNPNLIRMLFKGHTGLSVETDGSLRIQTDLEDLTLAPPTAVFSDEEGTESDASWEPVFIIVNDSTVRVTVGAIPSGSSVIIKTGRERYDPENAPSWWSTYYGWTGRDTQNAVECDVESNVYTCGRSSSQNFPVGQFELSAEGQSDWTVNKFNISGVPQWFTMIGDVDAADFIEKAVDISVGGEEFLYVGGLAASPWPNTLLRNPMGGYHDETFVNPNRARGAIVRMNKEQGFIVWGTFFGDEGLNFESIMGVEALSNGGVAVVGYTWQNNSQNSQWQNVNPGGGALQQDFGDMFIGEFNASDQLIWATKFGPHADGDNNEANYPADIAADGSGNLFVVGQVKFDGTPSNQDNFPTAGGLPIAVLGDDGFVAKFSGSRALAWSTYLGGSSLDYCSGVAVDDNTDEVVVLGTTSSTVGGGFPIVNLGVPNGDDGSLDGPSDLFLAKFSNNGTLLHTRYFGGENQEFTDSYPGYSGGGIFTMPNPCNGIAVGAEGNIYISGSAGADLPTVWPSPQQVWYFPNFSGGTSDAFVAAFASDFSLGYCTYLGSSREDRGNAIAYTDVLNDPRPTVVMVGRTENFSNNYPTAKEVPNSYYNNVYLDGPFDGVISRISFNATVSNVKAPQLAATSVQISPNPATNTLSCSIENKYIGLPGVLSVHDMTGKLLRTHSFDFAQKLTVLDIQNLPDGLYIASISFEKGTWSGKFVKTSR